MHESILTEKWESRKKEAGRTKQDELMEEFEITKLLWPPNN